MGVYVDRRWNTSGPWRVRWNGWGGGREVGGPP